MRRIVVLLTVAAMVAVMMVVSAAPAFALPPNPIHGQRVSAVAKFYPVDPVRGPFHGRTVSAVAKSKLPGCTPNEDGICPAP